MNMILKCFTAIAILTVTAAASPAAVFTNCPVASLSANQPALWLLCAEGRVAVTPDDGATWHEYDVPSDSRLRTIGALGSERAFVAGDDGALFATADGGRTWDRLAVPTGEHLTAMTFVGESGWITGWGGVVLHTADGGQTWELQNTNTSQALEAIHFAGPLHGWAVGWVGTIIRTTDGGKTWNEIRAPEALWSLSSVYFRDPQNGWAAGFMGQILRSRDGGLTWEKQKSPVESWLRSIHFDGTGRGWIAAEDGVVFTDDNGESWTYAEIDDRLAITELATLNGALAGATPRGLLQLTEAGAPIDRPRPIFAFGDDGYQSNLEYSGQPRAAPASYPSTNTPSNST